MVVWSVLSGLRKVGGESVAEYSAGIKFTDVITGKLEGLLEFIEAHKVSEEHRLSGIRFHISAPGKAFLGNAEHLTVRLLSRSGMLVETGFPLDLEREYDMEIQPPGFANIRFRGRVASVFEVLDEDSPRYEMGIEFKDMSPGDESRLDAFVRTLASD
jgi:hypothetical protein